LPSFARDSYKEILILLTINLMKKKIIYLSLIVLTGLFAYGCSSNKAKVTPDPTIPSATVSIAGFAFSPASVSVKVGQSVTWTNKDNAPHTATDLAGAFDSGSIATSQSFNFVFHTAGTYTYHCLIHSMMASATVVVTN
jgi:plastocyanin